MGSYREHCAEYQSAHASAEQVAVLLLGGPPDWHTSRLQMPAAALDDVETAGAMLISEHLPPRDAETEDPAPRAHYSPDPAPADPGLWWFRGWVPTTMGRPEWRRPSPAEHADAQVACDAHGAPLGWTTPQESWRIDRHQIHWVYEGESAAGGDIGVWQVRAHSAAELVAGWELVHDPAVGWTAARIPPRVELE